MQDIFLAGHRPPVLLLHGLHGNPLELQLLAQRLHRGGHTVRIPYLSGYGQRAGDCAPVLPWEQWESLASARLATVVGGLRIKADLALHSLAVRQHRAMG